MPHTKSLGAVPVAMTPRQRFEEYLQHRGMRNTEQRRTLVEHIFAHHQHFDADQLIEQLPAKGEPGYVSRPTVYRTLAEFVDAGLLRKFELAGRAVYEHDYGYPQHDHLYCTQCHRLFEFETDELGTLLTRVAHEQGFQVRGHRLLVHGICAECGASAKRTVAVRTKA
jgi:Fur family transcriptional regulator, ferric uptake regulator